MSKLSTALHAIAAVGFTVLLPVWILLDGTAVWSWGIYVLIAIALYQWLWVVWGLQEQKRLDSRRDEMADETPGSGTV